MCGLRSLYGCILPTSRLGPRKMAWCSFAAISTSKMAWGETSLLTEVVRSPLAAGVPDPNFAICADLPSKRGLNSAARCSSLDAEENRAFQRHL
ncbi:protein of unknown function [Candidatus Filomicrobium marinum]|uniref:Uncharacterized protein n=1 Tax=Candidatus Filomicrobium marinum TaxID=1608628 RepID=A0A0D6JGQ0_9HYPH|nr:protein of unknown function [Candidatus Filomicrobium marinum]CPR20360.1 protein of unknown function [Candidatus Filomicrobium marinum]